MRFNPFEEKPMPLDQLFMDWDKPDQLSEAKKRNRS